MTNNQRLTTIFKTGQKVMLIPGMEEEFPALITPKIKGRVGKIEAIRLVMGVQILFVSYNIPQESVTQKIPASLVVPVSQEKGYSI